MIVDPTIIADYLRRPCVDEYTGGGGSPCDPRQAHPRREERRGLDALPGPGRPESPERIRELVGAPEGAEVVASCHSGSRSGARDARAAQRRLRRAQLLRLVARVVAPRRAPARAPDAEAPNGVGERLSRFLEHALGGVEERRAERSPELVPRADVRACLLAQAFWVGRRILEVGGPAVELERGHFGMELHAPARVAETERLRRAVGARELDGSVGTSYV